MTHVTRTGSHKRTRKLKIARQREVTLTNVTNKVVMHPQLFLQAPYYKKVRIVDHAEGHFPLELACSTRQVNETTAVFRLTNSVGSGPKPIRYSDRGPKLGNCPVSRNSLILFATLFVHVTAPLLITQNLIILSGAVHDIGHNYNHCNYLHDGYHWQGGVPLVKAYRTPNNVLHRVGFLINPENSVENTLHFVSLPDHCPSRT